MSLLFTSVHDAPGWVFLSAGLVMGVAGAAHCAGMCGAFPLALAANSKSALPRLARSSLYNTGRGLTYVIIGSLAAGLGTGFHNTAGLAEAGRWAATVLGVAAALVIALSGLFLLGIRIPLVATAHGTGGLGGFVIRAGRGVVRSPHPMAPVTLGVINGLLPCPLVYAMLASAFTLGAFKQPLAGITVAAGFAAGTVPVMLALGMAGGPLFSKLKPRLAKVAGVLLLLFAGVTVMRAVSPDAIHDLMPGHSHQAMPAGHLMLGERHFDANGNLMEKLEGMSDEEYQALVDEEAEISEQIGALLEAGDVAGLRELNRRMSAPEGMMAWTLTPQDMAALLADPDAPPEFTYRCACCGTPKQQSKEFLRLIDTGPGYFGFTLLLPKDQPLPWRQAGE